VICGAAYFSHLAMDWLGVDTYPPRGIRALWPFSDAWFISGWDVFAPTERGRIFSGPSILTNLRAVVQELAVVGPIAAAAWWMRRRRMRPSDITGQYL
jgi:hypothetical protein